MPVKHSGSPFEFVVLKKIKSLSVLSGMPDFRHGLGALECNTKPTNSFRFTVFLFEKNIFSGGRNMIFAVGIFRDMLQFLKYSI